MKLFLVFAVLVGSALAGVRELSPQEESEIIDLYNRLCGRGDPKDPIEVNRRWVYCKTGPTRRPTFQQHNENIVIATPKPITVLINRPPTQHNHKITVNGEHTGQDTKIYVLPQEDSHKVEVEANVVSRKQKPTVYYIKDRQAQSGSSGQFSPAYNQPAQYNPYGPQYSASELVPALADAPAEVADVADVADVEGGAPFVAA